MLFNPPSLPTSSSYKIIGNINTNKVNTNIISKVTSTESLRYQFWTQLTELMNSSKKLQNERFWIEKKAYLYETLNLLEQFSEYGNIYCGLKYWSVFGNDLGHSPCHIVFEGSGECVATAELIMSRYAYAFALLACQQDRYNQFAVYKNNPAAIIDKTSEIISDVEDAALRMAKFNFSKKQIWAGLDNETLLKYKGFVELNYLLVEPTYL